MNNILLHLQTEPVICNIYFAISAIKTYFMCLHFESRLLASCNEFQPIVVKLTRLNYYICCYICYYICWVIFINLRKISPLREVAVEAYFIHYNYYAHNM